MTGSSARITDICLLLALLIVNLKADCGMLEAAFQIFLFFILVIQKSSWFSSDTYLKAYLQRYRETIQSNEHVREVAMKNIRNSISAIQLLVQGHRSFESMVSDTIDIKVGSSIITLPKSNRGIVQNIKNIAQQLSCYDRICRHQFLESDMQYLVQDSHSMHRLTHDVINNEGLFCVNTLDMLKNSLFVNRDLASLNKITTSVFLIQPRFEIPKGLMLNREVVAAILTTVLGLVFASAKKQGVSIYVQWKPKVENMPLFRLSTRPHVIDPVLVLSPLFIDSSIYLSNPIVRQLSLIAVNDPAEPAESIANLPIVQPSGDFGKRLQSLQELKEENDYIPILHNSQLKPYSFSSNQKRHERSDISSIKNISGSSKQMRQIDKLSSFSKSERHSGNGNTIITSNLAEVRLRGSGSQPSQSRKGSSSDSSNEPEQKNTNSLEKVLRRFDEIEQSKDRRQFEQLDYATKPISSVRPHFQNLTQRNFQFGLNQKQLRQNIAKSTENSASSSFDPQSSSSMESLGSDLQFKPISYPKWYEKANQNNDLSRVSERSKEYQSSQKKSSELKSQDGSNNIGQNSSGSNKNRRPRSSSSNQLKGSEIQNSLENAHIYDSVVSQISKSVSAKSEFGYEEEEKKSMAKSDETPMQRQRVMKSLSNQDMNDSQEVPEIPEEDVSADKRKAFLDAGVLANPRMSQFKAATGPVRYVFVDGDEESESIRRGAVSQRNPTSQLHQILHEERKVFDWKGIKHVQGSCGETHELFDNIDEEQMRQSSEQEQVQPAANPVLISNVSVQRKLSQFSKEQEIFHDKDSSSNSLGNPPSSQCELFNNQIEEMKSLQANSSDKISGKFGNPSNQLSSQLENAESILESTQKKSLKAQASRQSFTFKGSSNSHESSERNERSIQEQQHAELQQIQQDVAKDVKADLQKQKAQETVNQKTIQVRSKGKSKSIQVPGIQATNLKQKISRLNNFNPRLKQHRGSVQLESDLESIEEESISILASQSLRSYRRHSDPVIIQSSDLLPIFSSQTSKVEPAKQLKKASSFVTYQFGVIVKQNSSNVNKDDLIVRQSIEKASIAPQQDIQSEESQSEKEAMKPIIKLSSEDKKQLFKIERSLSNQFEQRNYARANSFGGLSSSHSSQSSASSIQINNYGHSRKSNLQEKALQMKKLNRSKSVVSALNEHSRIEVILQPNPDKTEKQSSSNKQKTDSSCIKLNSSGTVQQIKQQSFEQQLAELRKAQYVDESSDNSNVESFIRLIEQQCGTKKPNEEVRTMLKHLLQIEDQERQASLPSLGHQSSINKKSEPTLKIPSSFDHISLPVGSSDQLSSQPPPMNKDLKIFESHLIQPNKEPVSDDGILRANLEASKNQTIQFGEESESSTLVQIQKDSKNRTEPAPNSKEKRKQSRSPSGSKSKNHERFKSYYAKLKTQVGQKERSKDMSELLQILNSWGKHKYLPQPESQADLFDGVLQIHIFDVQTCKHQSQTRKFSNEQNANSSNSVCNELNCNRRLAGKLSKGNLGEQKWTDILHLNFKKHHKSPELELCSLLAEMIDASVLMQPSSEGQGAQFCISIPTINADQL